MDAAKLRISSGDNGDRDKDKPHWRVSPEEIALVRDPAWILTKNSILARAVSLFAELSERWKGKLEDLPVPGPGLLSTAPKISRGENYKGMPWVVLDYPRSFGKEDVFAIRTLFWWGHYFSVTLHLKGNPKQLYLPVIRQHIGELAAAGFHIGISGDEWRHELEGGNYRSLEGMKPEEWEAILVRPGFLKFSAKCGLEHWNEAGEEIGRLYGTVINALHTISPRT